MEYLTCSLCRDRVYRGLVCSDRYCITRICDICYTDIIDKFGVTPLCLADKCGKYMQPIDVDITHTERLLTDDEKLMILKPVTPFSIGIASPNKVVKLVPKKFYSYRACETCGGYKNFNDECIYCR